MASYESGYDEAVASGLLPGAAAIAGNSKGEIVLSMEKGKASLQPGRDVPFDLDTICKLASCTKILTSLAVMQCVEDGVLQLDSSVSHLVPKMGRHGILTSWDDTANKGVFKQFDPKVITLRMLLSNTSGFEYDWFNPLLMKWRASRGEYPWFGAAAETKADMPLVCEPGTAFRYSVGFDWAAVVLERATGETLEGYMQRKIWKPLGTSDITFFPKFHPRKEHFADLATLNEQGEGPATDFFSFDMDNGLQGCSGGGGIFASTRAFFTIIHAILRRDTRLLKQDASWDEFFRPQLDSALEQSMNDYFFSSPSHSQFLGMGIPREIRRNWSFAGSVNLDAQDGRFSKKTITWAGVPPSVTWYIDQEAGLCGVATVQIMPPMLPSVMVLHESFQRAARAANT